MLAQEKTRTIAIPGMSEQYVLIVDDETEIAEALKTAIERRLPMVRALTATSVDDAIAILNRQRIDVLITDYRMPGRHGVELLAEARVLRPGLPRVLMTAYAEERLPIREIVHAAPDHFLSKPFRVDEAIRTVEAALAGRRG